MGWIEVGGRFREGSAGYTAQLSVFTSTETNDLKRCRTGFSRPFHFRIKQIPYMNHYKETPHLRSLLHNLQRSRSVALAGHPSFHND